jgi:glycerophosphoryl diester phosphodiesterase
VQSFDWEVVARVHQIAPGLRTGCLTRDKTVKRGEAGLSPWTAGLDVDDHGGSVPRLVRALGCPVWTPDHRTLTADEVAEAHALSLRVIPWTVDRAEAIDRLCRWRVDGLITDHPARTRRRIQRASAR